MPIVSGMNNSEKQRKILLEGSVPKVIITMAIPSIIMQVITLIYNTVDTYFISQIDKSAAAAVGAVFAIQAVIQAVGFGFGMGVSSLCSRKLGENLDKEAEKYAISGIFGAAVFAAVIALIGFLFLSPILRVVGCTETMLPYAKPYAMVILLFAPTTCITFVVNNVFKAEGHMNYSMYGNVTGTIVNVILDPLFIFAFGMGTFGAALATCISHCVSLIIFWALFYSGKTVIKLKLCNISKTIDTYSQIVTTGLPTIFRQGLASLASALLCKQASVYGDAAVAAVTISNKCYMLVRNIVLGIGQGTQPVAGYNYGAKLFDRAKASINFAIKIGTVFCLCSTGLLYFFAHDIMWWFCKDEGVSMYGVEALRYASLVIPVMAFSTLVNQAYQSFGYKRMATFLASCRQGVCFVPIILILPVFLEVRGVEMAQPLSDFLTFVISIPFYVLMVKRLNDGQKQAN